MAQHGMRLPCKPTVNVSHKELREAVVRPGTHAVVGSTMVWLALVNYKNQGEPQPLTNLACYESREGNICLAANVSMRPACAHPAVEWGESGRPHEPALSMFEDLEGGL